VIDRLYLRRNVVPLSPLPFPFGFSPHLLAQKSSLLYFHALTNCKFHNPFVLTFIQNARGCIPYQALGQKYPKFLQGWLKRVNSFPDL
jgi:hypothetical protein